MKAKPQSSFKHWISSNTDLFFKVTGLTVCSNLFFVIVLAILHARFEAALLLGETILTIPCLLYVNRKHEKTARLGLILSVAMYVYTISESLNLPFSVSHYYVAQIPLSIIFFGPQEKRWRLAGVLIPVATCLFQAFAPKFFYTQTIPEDFPYEVLKGITFLGAGYLMYAFLCEFRRVDQNARELDQFFSVSQDLLCIVNSEGMFTKVNPAFGKILGYSEDELLGSSFLDWISSEHRTEIRERFHSVSQRDNRSFQFESRWRCKDGTLKILNWSSTTDLSKKSVYAAVIDMTAIRRQESQLQQTMDAINRSAIVAITDRRGNITSVNENFCRISGYTKEELIGQNHRILKSDIHSEQFFHELWKTISNGKVWSGEIQNRSKEGELYTVQTVISPIFDMNGKIESYLSIRFDVSQLKESQQRLEEAQRVAKIGSWSLDVSEGEFRWSKQMFKFFTNIKETTGAISYQEFLNQLDEEDKSTWEEAVYHCLEDGEAFRLRFQIQVDKKQRWIEAIGYAQIDGSGSNLILSGTCQDLTDLVEAEEQTKFERAKSLHASKLASLGELSAGIAHEINNPLAIISGTANLIPDLLDDQEKVLAKIEKIDKACDRIAKIVTGLRKFARSTEKQEFQPHSLNKIVEEVLILTDANAKRTNTPLMVNCKTSAEIYCSDIEIEQVLVNLINNSIDAVKNLDERWVKVELLEEGASIVLRVIDSGNGIPFNVSQKLFQPFFTTKPVGEGTGLGLSIAKGILDNHKATIEVKLWNLHTCFEIRFPRFEEMKHAS